MKEANKLKVLILGECSKMSRLPEFPESGSLEILTIESFKNKEEDVKIEKLRNLKVLRLKNSCVLGKIKGGTFGMMKGLQELNLCNISCDYETFRQTVADIEDLSSLQVLNVNSHCLFDILEGNKLPKFLKKLHTSSGFANVEELLDLEKFAIWGNEATTELAIPPAVSSRGGDTSSTIIPWINSSKLKSMELVKMKRIIMVESKDTLLPSSLTELTISRVDSERIPNLKNLRNLTELKIEECRNLEEVQGIGGLKSLQVVQIDGVEKLTRIHGLGNLMSSSICKLTECVIRRCPLLCQVVTSEQQDDDGNEGERDRYVLVRIESLVKMEILDSPSIDCRSIPRLSKFPRLRKLKIGNIGLNINEESASQHQHQQLEGLETLDELVQLYISNVELKRILNLKNLGNLTELELRECPNLQEVQGLGGLKSLQVICIDGAEELTRIHGLGYLMSCSKCKLTELVIRKCPLLREVVNSTLSKFINSLRYLRLEDFPALQEIVGPGDLKTLWLIMNGCFSLERLHIKDLPLHCIEFDYRGCVKMNYDFDLSDLSKLRLTIKWPHEELLKAEAEAKADSAMEILRDMCTQQ